MCGEIDFQLNQENGDCAVEFLDFAAVTDRDAGTYKQERDCDIKITVDLPDGWAIAPSRLALEGDFQVGAKGRVWVDSSYRMEGGDTLHLTDTWEGELCESAQDAFLLEVPSEDQPRSPCGGEAVFTGTFSIGAECRTSRPNSEIHLTTRQRGSTRTYWGWDYEECEPEPEPEPEPCDECCEERLPSHCYGIAGDPAFAHLYPECHPEE